MEIGNILSADVLDIIFDNRNKEYGAYDLRKNYRQRLMKATASMLLLVVLLLVAYILVASMKPKDNKLLVGPDVTLIEVPPPPDKPVDPLPPPPPLPPAPTVKMLALTAPPLIVEDDKVKPEDMPPPVDELENAKIGLVNAAGTDDPGIVAPVETAKGVVAAPEKKDEAEVIFTKVEIESKYPGGNSAWGAFLNRNLTYPQEAADIEVQGTVYIQFIVDTEGNVSDVSAISGPEELRKAAVAVIKKSGKWDPAIQNGKKVKSYKKQPISFRLEN
jgi:protein TonB